MKDFLLTPTDRAKGGQPVEMLEQAFRACYSPTMAANQKQAKELAMAWKRAAPRLAAMRRRDIRRQDNARAIVSLNRVFREMLRITPPRRSSGFVEMYRILSRSKR